MVIRRLHNHVTNAEGGDGLCWEIAILHEGGKEVTYRMIVSKRPFDVFDVSGCMVEILTGVQ